MEYLGYVPERLAPNHILSYAMPCFMSQRSYKLYRVVLTKPNGIQQQRQMAELHVLSPDFHWNLARPSLLTQTKLAAEEKENFGPWGAALHCRSL